MLSCKVVVRCHKVRAGLFCHQHILCHQHAWHQQYAQYKETNEWPKDDHSSVHKRSQCEWFCFPAAQSYHEWAPNKAVMFDWAPILSPVCYQHLLYLSWNTVSYYHSRCQRVLALPSPLSQHLHFQHSSQNSLTSHIHHREYQTASTRLEEQDAEQAHMTSDLWFLFFSPQNHIDWETKILWTWLALLPLFTLKNMLYFFDYISVAPDMIAFFIIKLHLGRYEPALSVTHFTQLSPPILYLHVNIFKTLFPAGHSNPSEQQHACWK